MIEVNHITKRYGEHIALDDVSFTLRNDRIYGLLGPNGAGKSTTMNILTGCLAPSEGEVTVNGYDLYKHSLEAKKQIGYLPERPPVYGDMTVYEYLDFVAEAKGIRSADVREGQVERVMKATDTADVSDRLIKNLSKGFQQRVGIAQALLGDPSIIILDEPMVGLDPRQVMEMRALIRKLAHNRTVIVSSHILALISEICDHIIILANGRVVADDELEVLEKAATVGGLALTVKGDPEAVRETLLAVDGVRSVELGAVEGSKEAPVVTVTVHTDKTADVRDDIFFALADKRYAVISMEEKESSLEQIFISLTDDPSDDTKEDDEE